MTLDEIWAGTTLRAIARGADVDPALIYHYFGSKEALLDAATTPPARWLADVAATWTTRPADLGVALLRLMLSAWADDESSIFDLMRTTGVIGDDITDPQFLPTEGVHQ